MSTKKALILSGGGGRGAFQAGVLAGLVEVGWMADGQGPDFIAGTSIGAVHAAALASGKTTAALQQFWTEQLTTDLVHRLDGGWLTRLPLWVVMSGVLSPDLPQFPEESASTVLSAEDPPPAEVGGLKGWVGRHLRDALLSETHLMTANWQAAIAPLDLDYARINHPSAPRIVITATDVQTGAPAQFINSTTPPYGITSDHLEASASIQLVYQPKALNGRWYWDGAVLHNTPLDPLLDLVGDQEVEIITVLMSPWITDQAEQLALPTNLYETMAPVLDWGLLASYRTAVKRLTDRYRPGPKVIAPSVELWQAYLNVDRLLLYDPATSAYLYEHGRQAALQAFA